MKKSCYLLRIDDVCETMKHSSFERIRIACEKYSITPILGIVPDNKDPNLCVDEPSRDFWQGMKRLVDMGWIIAQHGYQHIYIKGKTEFAGLPYDEQREKIIRGRAILQQKLGKAPVWFMAPAHSIDSTTCKALQDAAFTHITDGIALYPYTADGLTWVPQQLWRPIPMPFGLWTICLHPNTMSDEEIDTVVAFMKVHQQQFHNVSLKPRHSLFTKPMQLLWRLALAIKRL